MNVWTLVTFATTAMMLVSMATSRKTTWNFDDTCKQTADVIFVVDTSSSIWPPYFNKNTKDFVKGIIGNFNVGPGASQSRIGIIQFSSRVYREFHLKDYSSMEDIEFHIDRRMRYRGGNTYTHKALDYVAKNMLTTQNGRRENVSTLVIVITDGESGYPSKTKTATDFLKTKGVEVFAIGIGSRVREDELKYMASDPDEEFVFHVKGFSSIGDIEKRFANQTCKALRQAAADVITTTTRTTTTTNEPSTTTTKVTTSRREPATTSGIPTTTSTSTTTQNTPSTTTTTTTPSPPSSTSTTTTTTTTAAKVPTFTTSTQTTPTPTTITPSTTTTSTTTSPTTATTTTDVPTTRDQILNDQKLSEECPGKPADIYFLLDASSSIWIGHFHLRVLPFVRNLVKSFQISPTKTRVGLVTFSDKVDHVFDLSQNHNLESLLESLQPEKVPFLTGGTNTAEAISFVAEHGLGDDASRTNAAKILITLTDGVSQSPSDTAEAAKQAQDQGIKMFAIGVGKQVDDEELSSIASDPKDEFVFRVESFKALSSVSQRLTRKTCSVVGIASNEEIGNIDCSSQPLNVMFVYDYMNSIPNYRQTLDDVVKTFTAQAASRAPRSKIGLMTQPCIGGDIALMSVHDFQVSVAERSANYAVTLHDIVHRLSIDAFKPDPQATDKRVAVLVLDASTDNTQSLRHEVRRLKSQDVQVIVVAVGRVDERLMESVASYPMEHHVIRVEKYDYLKYSDLSLIERMCHAPAARHVMMNDIVFNGNVY